MEFPVLIDWAHLPCWVVIYNFIQILKVHYVCKKSTQPDQTPRSVASGLDLHCLALSHKINTTFNSVKISKERFLGRARIQKVLSEGV